MLTLSRKPCSQKCGMFSEVSPDQVCQVAASVIFPIWTIDEMKEIQSADSNLQLVVQLNFPSLSVSTVESTEVAGIGE